MRPTSKSSVWLVRLTFAFVLGVVTLAGAQNPSPKSLPDGPGKAILEGKCTPCHSLDPVINLKMDRAGWKAMVENMIGLGAYLKDDEPNVLTDYLAKNFGEAKSDADEAATKKLTFDACGSCHGMDLVEGLTYSKDEWSEVVNRMVSKGAELNDKQIPLVVEYLAKHYGPKKEEKK